MNPIKTQMTTATLGAPENWDTERDGECLGLPISREDKMMHSFWEPTPDERDAIAQGARVRLTVWGELHPPVGVSVAHVAAVDVDVDVADAKGRGYGA